ncbi:MAG: D-glycero-alpha-D-manno-heptose-1,7-bisphosphate 7-phosphatase [Tepidisphaerales bacterium]
MTDAPRAESAARQVVFFDRDNTLIVTDGYLKDPGQVRLMPGAAAAVARARRLGLAVAVASNQSGVARGLMTEADVHAVNRRLDELLQSHDPDARIDRHYFCPHHPDATVPHYRRDSPDRKPAPGMFLRGLRELGATGGFCIGDAPRDIAAGHAAGLVTILFRPDPAALGIDVPPSPAAAEPLTVAPDYVVTKLETAMDIIERLTTTPASPTRPAAGASAGPAGHAAPAAPAASPGHHGPSDLHRLEQRLDAILLELKRRPPPESDFSVARLFAGIAQVMALAVAVLAYVAPPQAGPVVLLLLAIFLQGLTASLLLMARR